MVDCETRAIGTGSERQIEIERERTNETDCCLPKAKLIPGHSIRKVSILIDIVKLFFVSHLADFIRQNFNYILTKIYENPDDI